MKTAILNTPISVNHIKVPIIDPKKIFEPQSLGFRLTYRCNAKCEHCYCYKDSDITQGDELELSKLKKLIPQVKKIGMTGIGLSGGEPFLKHKIVESIIEDSKKQGLDINISTNGYWGKTYEKAIQVLENLQLLGFSPPTDTIALSAGQYHMEYIKRDTTMNVIKAYKKVFNTTFPRIDFEYVKSNKQILDNYKSYLAENGVHEDDYCLAERTVFQTTGLSRITSETIINKRPISIFQGLCPWVKDLIVAPNGDVYPCCGFNRYIDGIIIGNINQHTLEKINNSAQVNPAVIMLKRHSFAYLHSLLSLKFELPNQADGLCDICEIIFSKQEHLDYLINNFSNLYK